MKRLVKDFTLTDADGAEHEYTVVAHPTSDGFRVTRTIAAALIDPLAQTGLPALLRLVPVAIKRGLDEDGNVDLARLIDDEDLDEQLGRLNLSEVGPGLRRAIESFDEDLVKQILSLTTRDGSELRGRHFDKAYQRNYGELYDAAWEVCTFNRFFSLPGGFANLAQAGMKGMTLNRKPSSSAQRGSE